MKKKNKSVQLWNLWNRKDCWGWAWRTHGRRYYYQNDNDLGLCGWVADVEAKEIVLHKVRVMPGKYVYVLRNSWNAGVEEDSEMTLPAIVAWAKVCHQIPLTEHEKKIVSRYETL